MTDNRSRNMLITLTIAALAGSSPLSAQEKASTKRMNEESPGLLAKATITPDAARKLATDRVANSTISKEELEVEDGKLVYSFDLKVAGKSGIEEVLIDAKTGKVISQEHESAKQEAEERAKEARAGKPPAPVKRKSGN